MLRRVHTWLTVALARPLQSICIQSGAIFRPDSALLLLCRRAGER